MHTLGNLAVRLWLGVYKMQARKELWEGEELRGTALPNNACAVL